MSARDTTLIVVILDDFDRDFDGYADILWRNSRSGTERGWVRTP